MTIIDPVILNLAVALGLGLLIGAERERRKGSAPLRSPAVPAATSGGLSFAARVIPGLILITVAAWAGAFYGFVAG
jgi:uncharacterized membrane protein YhiD involved in acid resistance